MKEAVSFDAGTTLRRCTGAEIKDVYEAILTIIEVKDFQRKGMFAHLILQTEQFQLGGRWDMLLKITVIVIL